MVLDIGKSDFQGAIFVYKGDASVADATAAVTMIATEHGGIRGVVTDDKANFLEAIKKWNESVDPDNAFLCIYAHMGELGINCIGGQAKTRITWVELARALSHGVHLLWLVGCESDHCLVHWNAMAAPVRDYLLATSESKYFLPLMKLFAAEISIKNIRPYDEMPAYLKQQSPELASVTRYYKADATGLRPAFPSQA